MTTVAQYDGSADRLFECQAEPVSAGIAAMAVPSPAQSTKLEPSREISIEMGAALVTAEPQLDAIQQRQMLAEPLASFNFLANDSFQLTANGLLTAFWILGFT